MVRSTPPSVDRATALRYMGAAGWEPDAASAALLDRAEERLLQTATPRAVWRILPRTAVSLENRGRDLARHLQSCDRILLMAATLGSEVDTLLRRMELTDIALAATADAMASVLLEQVCDALEEELRAQLRGRGSLFDRALCAGIRGLPVGTQRRNQPCCG